MIEHAIFGMVVNRKDFYRDLHPGHAISCDTDRKKMAAMDSNTGLGAFRTTGNVCDCSFAVLADSAVA